MRRISGCPQASATRGSRPAPCYHGPNHGEGRQQKPRDLRALERTKQDPYRPDQRATVMATRRSAEVIRYYAYDESSDLTCWKCGWRGPARDASQETYRELFDVSCPRCDKMLLIVPFPTADETKVAAAAGNHVAKENLPEVLQAEAYQRRAAEGALKCADQLCELDGESLAFAWDLEECEGDKWTVIRLGDTTVWRELAFYEGWPRFNQVKEILKERYGQRFESLTPDPGSELYLYGDDTSAPQKISTT